LRGGGGGGRPDGERASRDPSTPPEALFLTTNPQPPTHPPAQRPTPNPAYTRAVPDHRSHRPSRPPSPSHRRREGGGGGGGGGAPPPPPPPARACTPHDLATTTNPITQRLPGQINWPPTDQPTTGEGTGCEGGGALLSAQNIHPPSPPNTSRDRRRRSLHTIHPTPLPAHTRNQPTAFTTQKLGPAQSNLTPPRPPSLATAAGHPPVPNHLLGHRISHSGTTTKASLTHPPPGRTNNPHWAWPTRAHRDARQQPHRAVCICRRPHHHQHYTAIRPPPRCRNWLTPPTLDTLILYSAAATRPVPQPMQSSCHLMPRRITAPRRAGLN